MPIGDSVKVCIFSRRDYKEIGVIRKAFEVVQPRKADICIAVGGDGTFIRAAKSFDGPILPVRGNDAGSAAYYSDVGIDRIEEVCRLLKERKYIVERISHKLEVRYSGKRSYAINEVLLRNDSSNVYFDIYISKGGKRRRVYPFVLGGDGVLVTGAIGSTAYNRAAGGPIIMDPDALCITLLNPDGPLRNPVIVPDSSTIEVDVVRYTGFLECDGVRLAKFKKGGRFSVKKSEKRLDVVRLDGFGEDTAQKLRRLILEKAVDKFSD